MASITIQLALTSSISPSGVSSLTIAGQKGHEEVLVLDGVWRVSENKIIGEIETCASWCRLRDVGEEWLRMGWMESGAEGKREVVKFESKSAKRGWAASAVWGFQMLEGKRYLVRRMTITDGKKTVNAMAVYNFGG
jgi:hypothetical protein